MKLVKSLNLANGSDIVLGRILYLVTAFPTQTDVPGFIEKIIVLSKPVLSDIKELKGVYFYENLHSYFIDGKFGNFFRSNFSLRDCNIPENNYNHHRLFTDFKSAKTYLRLCDAKNIEELIEAGIVTKEKVEKTSEKRPMLDFLQYALD